MTTKKIKSMHGAEDKSLEQQVSTVQQAAPAACHDGAHMGEHACMNRSQCCKPCGKLGHSEEHAQAIHPDDEAVDRFAAVRRQSWPWSARRGAAAAGRIRPKIDCMKCEACGWSQT